MSATIPYATPLIRRSSEMTLSPLTAISVLGGIGSVCEHNELFRVRLRQRVELIAEHFDAQSVTLNCSVKIQSKPSSRVNLTAEGKMCLLNLCAKGRRSSRSSTLPPVH